MYDQSRPWWSCFIVLTFADAGLEGALASQRLELWRMGMEDLALLQLLGPTEAQTLALMMVRSATDYTFNTTLLEETRAKVVAELVEQQHCVVPTA